MSISNYTPGSLVSYRGRPWVILPPEEEKTILLKPLGGSEEEITGIYAPLEPFEKVLSPYEFPKPTAEDIGNFASAQLLYDAARLLFRNAAGPFRCLGKLSFRPRSYQMVPLVMALRQQPTRLLIADDVGIGKTVEALLIARERYERREIRGFAIICLPHLCEQWQHELKDKFGMEAVIIRSGTTTALERQIRNHETIFQAFPFQIISIDYIKASSKRQLFIDQCPDLVIVDEAHTCARPAGAHTSQQQRYHLLSELAAKPDLHLLLLTATPHSGKQEEFQSLLGLLRPEFEQIIITKAEEKQRRKVAAHFIQRRRADVAQWMGEDTGFPQRKTSEIAYVATNNYMQLFDAILAYARELTGRHEGDKRRQRFAYWEALALLRGVMSSPAAGVEMLRCKAMKKRYTEDDFTDESITDAAENDSVMDTDFATDDSLPLAVLENTAADSESSQLIAFAKALEAMQQPDKDIKAQRAIEWATALLKRDKHPIIFCRYIHTANYLGKLLKEALNAQIAKGLAIEVITGELNDEMRRERINAMQQAGSRLLVATDCLSEGINLQHGFNAVLHYDLPWNPNRLEQREGRIDRFGQPSPEVEVALLYGANNPMDGIVLDVLLRKAREIRRSTGISVPVPEDSTTVMQAITQAILFKNAKVKQLSHQLTIFDETDIEKSGRQIANAYEESKQRELVSRSIFAQNAIKADEIEADLRETDDAIGNVQTVADFVTQALRSMGVQIDKTKQGYRLFRETLPERLRVLLPEKPAPLLISFHSPTPEKYLYLGRNHPFVEHLCRHVLNNAINARAGQRVAARAAVIRTAHVQQKTVILQLRVRNVIAEKKTRREIVAEEMWLWGYRGAVSAGNFLSKQEAMELMLNAKPAQNMTPQEQAHFFNRELPWMQDVNTFMQITQPLAQERANHLVEAHTRFRQLVNGSQYEVATLLPMDVLGVYVLLPTV
jgi:superfamily II DNA or RNA helicase